MIARAVAAAGLAALVACAAAPPRAFTPADDTAVRAVLSTQATAWNRGDLAGYMEIGRAHV